MINLSDFNYSLPSGFIANKPASPRDSSKLVVYDTKSNEIFFDKFINLDKYLPKKSFLVLNDTKVIQARIILYKENACPQRQQPARKASLATASGAGLRGGRGGKVTVLFLVNEINQIQKSKIKSQNYNSKIKSIRGYVDRKVEVGDKLFFNSQDYIEAIIQEGSIFTFRLNFSFDKLIELLEKKGTMPIPLYIKNSPLNREELNRKYQTVFARAPGGARFSGSAAAPTASLHFTNRLFNKLEKKNIKKFFITLHVGLGTFAPIDEKNIKQKKLHSEFYEISDEVARCINTSKSKGYKLIAAGTTVVRTLETFANSNVKTQMLNLNATDLFIFPPYNFKMVDCLITNFHLPKSSLMMLVEAFLQYKKSKQSLVDLYNIAIKNNFRFYSFGDAMLIV